MGRPERRSAAHHDLDLLFAALDALDALAADTEGSEDESADEARIYNFSIRWGVLLAGRLHRLEHYDGLGELATDEKERYGELVRRLSAADPALRRLGLARPAPADR